MFYTQVRVVYDHLPIFAAKMRTGMAVAVDDTADQIVTTAKSLAPVMTGFLRDHIKKGGAGGADDVEGNLFVGLGSSPVTGFTQTVVSEAPYSGFVEFGTVHMAAQPFLTPAAEMHTATLNKMAAAALHAAAARF